MMLTKTVNVLVFPCGNENAIEVLNALGGQANIKVYGGSSEKDHGKSIFINFIDGLPFANHPDFFELLNKIIAEHKIDLIFPTHDAVVDIFAKNTDAVNCEVVCPIESTAAIIREKSKTYSFFKGNFFCPKVYDNLEEVVFPVFVKPSVGEIARGTFLANDNKSLTSFLADNPQQESIVCELLPGAEFSVDCFTDQHGDLIYSEPRIMKKFVRGIYLKSESVPKSERFISMAARINAKLTFRGLWYFQCKEDLDGNLKLLEIAQKVSGTMSLFRMNGVNFPLLTVWDRFATELVHNKQDYNVKLERWFFNRYTADFNYKQIFLAVSGTLIKNGIINEFLLAFLYQAKQRGKELVAIVENQQILEDYYIHRNLFNQYLNDGSDLVKFDFNQSQSIYIDDNLHIRSQIADYHKMLVFGTDALPMLYDWKL